MAGYNRTEPAMAWRLLERKLGHVEATGAAAVVTANPGCILQLAQLAAGLGARGRGVEILHVVEALDGAYLAAEGARQ